RRLVADGRLGRIGMVACQTYRSQGETAKALARLPNSVLWEIAVHHLDMLRYALGQRVVGAMAQRLTVPWGVAPPGASLQALLGLDGATRASYPPTSASRGHESFERGQEFYLRLVTERGALHVFPRWLLWCERGRPPRLLWRGPRQQPEEHTL